MNYTHPKKHESCFFLLAWVSLLASSLLLVFVVFILLFRGLFLSVIVCLWSSLSFLLDSSIDLFLIFGIRVKLSCRKSFLSLLLGNLFLFTDDFIDRAAFASAQLLQVLNHWFLNRERPWSKDVDDVGKRQSLVLE